MPLERPRWGVPAAAFWMLLCVRWFDAGVPYRPAWLAAAPIVLLVSLSLATAALWLRDRWGVLAGQPLGAWPGLFLVLTLVVLFRLPMAWQGAAGYVTADGSLSGIMAVHVRDGVDHPVFVPNVGYSGSLKSHLAAGLALVFDMPRAFAFSSLVFFALFVAGLYRLTLLVPGASAGHAMAAGLYLAFAPAFVTQYSLSNDGNYVEVLALGTWALLLAARWLAEKDARPTLALAAGILLGVAFWCHVLAVLHATAVVLVFAVAGRRNALGSFLPMAWGFSQGFFPGLLWNAQNGWFSFSYLVTGSHQAGPAGLIGFGERAIAMLTDHAPILLGYDPGEPGPWGVLLRVLAFLAVGACALALVAAVRAALVQSPGALLVLLVFALVNVVLALLGSGHIPGNPRYLLFLMAPVPIVLALAFDRGWRRFVMVALVALGALGSLSQAEAKVTADARWRGFVEALDRDDVRFCHTDYYIATKVNFLSGERCVCSSRLGPTLADYFRYGERVNRAPEAALIAVNTTNAAKLERRLQRLGVTYERREWMKPVLLRLSRKVDPEELLAARVSADP